MTPEEILALPMRDNDADATTIKGYLIELLHGVWNEREGFSGKRPFGSSGWQFDLYLALGQGGLIEMRLDQDGYLDELKDDQRALADRLITSAIGAL